MTPDPGSLDSHRRVRVELLGPVQIRVGDTLVAAGGPKLRAMVATLALARGRVVSVGSVLDAVWGEDLPATARNTLQYHVGVVRKALAAHDADYALVTREPGYALTADTDVDEFTHLAAEAAQATDAGNHAEAAASASRALNLWRGTALSDLREFEFAEARAVALEDQHMTCLVTWVDAELQCGRAKTIVGQLQDLVRENPTHERLWEQLMVALYQTGRQDSALTAYRSARRALDRELGIEPGERLVAVHQAILNHDPSLKPLAAGEGNGYVVAHTNLVTSVAPGGPPTLHASGGRRVTLTGAPVVIGRDGDCDLALADPQASRRHAQVEGAAAGFVLVDLDSTNGTRLNSAPVTDAMPLADGDRIEIGHSVVVFRSGTS